jgi:phenylacetate-CoA ligase
VIGSAALWAAIDSPSVLRAGNLNGNSAERISRERLGRLLLHAAHSSAFYKRRFRAVGIEWSDPILTRDPYQALSALPAVSKGELRQAGVEAVAGGRVRSSWYSSSSSGSTGEPFRVYYDPRAWATLKYLVKLRARRACGVRVTDRVALLDAVPARQPRSGMEWTGSCARISVLQPASDVAKALVSFAPDVVYGLPSALREVGYQLELGGQRLPVRSLFTSGELLERGGREALAGVFGAPVYDIYGTSETKEIAWECTSGGMHLNTDVVRLEVLDDAGHSLPADTEGNLVATLLVNRAMPLLRYRTGDRGTLSSGTCRCGRSSPLLGIVTGRAADVLVLHGGQRISPYALTCAIEGVPGVLRYQVNQLNPAKVKVRAIVEGSVDSEAVAAQVESALRLNVAPFLDVEVEFVDRLPTGPRAKFRVVQPLPAGIDGSLSPV